MPRLVAVVLLLTLALTPAVSAEPTSRGESPFSGWLDAFWDALDGISSWLPTLRSEPRRSGAAIIPSGIHAAPRKNGATIIPSGMRAAPRKNGAMVIPSGIRSSPDSVGNPGRWQREAVRRVD